MRDVDDIDQLLEMLELFAPLTLVIRVATMKYLRSWIGSLPPDAGAFRRNRRKIKDPGIAALARLRAILITMPAEQRTFALDYVEQSLAQWPETPLPPTDHRVIGLAQNRQSELPLCPSAAIA